MKFTELNLDERLMHGIRDLGFTDCTDVQAETFTHTLRGRDVAVQSQTGTGKTAAFLISIFQLWLTDEKYRSSQALVVAPTRELAVQIERDAATIGKYLPFKSACFYGGVGYAVQEKAVADGVDLIIGTPGRLLDFNQSGKLDFRAVGILVIDEADRLFDMGFYPDIRKIMRRARPRTERITMLYSATLSTNVRNISWQFMNEPVEIEIAPEQLTVDLVKQMLYHVSKDEKFRVLLGILKKENPGNALIFCNTKRATEIVAKKLQMNGYPCEFIMGDLPQKKRIKIIDSMKSGELRMLCATDVAARGLHVDDLDMVINYDLPEDPEAYVHRIGRTARAGKTGLAVSLACERFVYSLEPIEELIGQKIPTERVTSDLIAEDESAGRRLPPLFHRDEVDHRRQADRHRGPRRPGGQHGSFGGDHRGGGRTAPRPRPADSRAPVEHRSAARPSAPRRSAADVHAGEHAAKRHQSPGKRPARPAPGGPRRVNGDSIPADRGPSRTSSVEDRLAYYKRKYGEDFGSGPARATENADSRASAPESAHTPASEPKTGRQKPEDGLLGAIGRLFGKNRSRNR